MQPTIKKMEFIKQPQDHMNQNSAKKGKLPKTKSFDDIKVSTFESMMKGKYS